MLALLLAAEAGGEAGHAAENGWFLPHDLNEFWWGLAAFVAIVALLVWKVLPIAKKGLAGRTAKIAAQLDQAEAQRKAAEGQIASIKASLATVDQESERIVADARQRAAQLKADLIARAETEVAEAKRRGLLEVEAAKSQSLADVRAEVAAMTLKATEAVVDANLTADVQTDLIEQYIAQVGAAR